MALRYQVPSITNNRRNLAEAGLLMTYGPNQAAIYRRLGAYIDQILKGAYPGDLPVEQLTVFELFVNVKTLHTLGLTIPPAVLPLVTEWIE